MKEKINFHSNEKGNSQKQNITETEANKRPNNFMDNRPIAQKQQQMIQMMQNNTLQKKASLNFSNNRVPIQREGDNGESTTLALTDKPWTEMEGHSTETRLSGAYRLEDRGLEHIMNPQTENQLPSLQKVLIETHLKAISINLNKQDFDSQDIEEVNQRIDTIQRLKPDLEQTKGFLFKNNIRGVELQNLNLLSQLLQGDIQKSKEQINELNEKLSLLQNLGSRSSSIEGFKTKVKEIQQFFDLAQKVQSENENNTFNENSNNIFEELIKQLENLNPSLASIKIYKEKLNNRKQIVSLVGEIQESVDNADFLEATNKGIEEKIKQLRQLNKENANLGDFQSALENKTKSLSLLNEIEVLITKTDYEETDVQSLEKKLGEFKGLQAEFDKNDAFNEALESQKAVLKKVIAINQQLAKDSVEDTDLTTLDAALAELKKDNEAKAKALEAKQDVIDFKAACEAKTKIDEILKETDFDVTKNTTLDTQIKALEAKKSKQTQLADYKTALASRQKQVTYVGEIDTNIVGTDLASYKTTKTKIGELEAENATHPKLANYKTELPKLFKKLQIAEVSNFKLLINSDGTNGTLLDGQALLRWYDTIVRNNTAGAPMKPFWDARTAANGRTPNGIDVINNNNWQSVWGKMSGHDAYNTGKKNNRKKKKRNNSNSNPRKRYPIIGDINLGAKQYEIEDKLWVNERNSTTSATRYNTLGTNLQGLGKPAHEVATNIRKSLTATDANLTHEHEKEAAMAMLGAETARNPRSMGVGLMLLDLVENQEKYGKSDKNYSWNKMFTDPNFGGAGNSVNKYAKFTGITPAIINNTNNLKTIHSQNQLPHAYGGKWSMSPLGSMEAGQGQVPANDTDLQVVHFKEMKTILRWFVYMQEGKEMDGTTAQATIEAKMTERLGKMDKMSQGYV